MLTACGTSAPSVPVSIFQNWKFRAEHQVTKGHQSRTDNDYTDYMTGLSDFPVIPPRQNRTSSLELHGYLARCIQQDPTGSTWNDWEISIQIHSFRLLLETRNRNMIFEDAPTCSQSYSIERREQRLKNVQWEWTLTDQIALISIIESHNCLYITRNTLPAAWKLSCTSWQHLSHHDTIRIHKAQYRGSSWPTETKTTQLENIFSNTLIVFSNIINMQRRNKAGVAFHHQTTVQYHFRTVIDCSKRELTKVSLSMWSKHCKPYNFHLKCSSSGTPTCRTVCKKWHGHQDRIFLEIIQKGPVQQSWISLNMWNMWNMWNM